MRVKIIIEAFIDSMPEIDECVDIAGMDAFAGREAVDMVTRQTIKDEGLHGAMADEYRILETCPIEVSTEF